METKIEFGTKDAIKAPAPKSATYTFRTIFIITSVLTGLVAGTQLIDEMWKVEVMGVLKAVDLVAWGVSRMLGVVVEKE